MPDSCQLKARLQVALKVVNSTGYNGTLKVTNNYGMQGSTYNPQKTAPSTVLQKPYNPQPATYNPQRTAPARVVQPAGPTPEQVRVAAEAEQRRVQEIRRQQVQGALDLKVTTNKSNFNLRVASMPHQAKLSVGRYYSPAKIKIPKADGSFMTDEELAESEEYSKVKEAAKAEALKFISSQNTTSSWGWIGDKLSGNSVSQDHRRKYAEKYAQEFADRQTKVYQGKLDAHNALQAKLQSDYEAKRSKLSDRELNDLADQYNQQLKASVADLNRVAAYTEGKLEGLGQAASAKLTGKGGQTLSFINRNVIQKAVNNPVWKYTLGEGDRNIPSIVTAPSRLINMIGNLNTKDREIYKYGGETASRIGSRDNAWQASFNQRNFNIRPVVDKPYNWTDAKKEIQKDGMAKLQFDRLKNDKEKEDFAKRYWDNRNRSLRNQNTMQELAADPLNLLAGAGAIIKTAKGGKYLSKVDDVARNTKYISSAMKAADKVIEVKNAFKATVGNSKVVKFLTKEYKTPTEQLQDAIKVAKETQGAQQDAIFRRVNEINKKLAGGNAKLDISVFDDFARLSDYEAQVIQRMVDGKLTARDRLMLVGKNNAPVRANLERIAAKWNDFAEQMKLADNINNTRFGAGKRTYSPRTVWLKNKGKELDEYDFRLRKRFKGEQSASDFKQGAVDRYFKSKLDDLYAKSEGKKTARLVAERDELLKRYDDAVMPAREAVEKAYSKTQSPIEKLRRAAGAPTRLWKKSVLKYRPAWTVNNVLYNTQAGMLSGGMKYLPEQARMLRPSYARKALSEVPDEVRTKLAKEIGSTGKLNKFYANVENNPRIAAYRALVKDGLTPEQALKRVDKYFFNYTTKNWERPVKAVLPFWAWQKNLTKAAVKMPFDRPMAAIAYNRTERYQKQDFEKQFGELVPELKKYGYSDEEIEQFKQEQAKYYAKRLRIGNKYYTTPFNAFSEQGLTSMGFNPYLAAASESAEGVDSFGRKISGNEASLFRRLTTKFPQAELGYKKYKGWRVDKGLDKPSTMYIGKEGSEGYGLTKEKQGYDPTKSNYVPSLDPRTKNKQDVAAFFGKPRGLEFDKGKFLEGKKYQKLTAEYFEKSSTWKNMSFDEAEAQRNELFSKYGLTADDFYSGVLSKYDTDHTKKIKALKEDAAAKNKALFEEYAKQPKGERNLWATKKLNELNSSGYFNDNPFLKSFKWLNRESYEKAGKQELVKHAIKTGDWSQYRKQYGSKQSQKSKDWQTAKASGDWSNYRSKYGTKTTPYSFEGKYFKTAESMERYKEGQFWQKYTAASAEDRRKLLAENPQYNRRGNWTDEQWDIWKIENKQKQIAKLRNLKGNDVVDKYLRENNRKAYMYKSARGNYWSKKAVAYS